MKIESYEKKKLSKEDLPEFKQILAKGYSEEDVSENDYSVLFSKLFDREAFLRLCYLDRRVLRNNESRKDFVFSVRFAYSLIQAGEKYLTNNDDYYIENAVGKLYEILGFILFSDEIFDIVPGSSIRSRYNVSPDNKLARCYFERAILIDPNLLDSYFALGLYYLRIKNYHKAFAYLIKTEISDFDDVPAYAALFTELGCYFDEEFKESLTFFDSQNKAFRCFERAYYTFNAEPREKEVIYNMAYTYLEGIGVIRNKRKGLSLLKELDVCLKANGNDIAKEEDPDGIINNYYLPKQK